MSRRLPGGLVYVVDDVPGIRRRRAGRGFAYYLPDGAKLRDKLEVARINSLAIPPAYQRVWISPMANGHLQATGFDDRKRKQYRYHPDWQALRARAKFSQIAEFGQALPEIRAAVASALRHRELDRERVVATLVRMLDQTACRIGNLSYRDENGTYGLSTLECEHVDAHGSTVDLSYRGKGGSEIEASLRSGTVAKIVRKLQELPGQHLFKFRNGRGDWHPVESHDVNEWLQEVSGKEFTAKNFRTWHASRLALEVFSETEAPTSTADAVLKRNEGIKEVASRLHHRPATCRKYYVHPEVVERFEAGRLRAVESGGAPPVRGLAASEEVLLKLVRKG
ncbi:MAG: DNA topoisomerase IB [Chthoniobacterales bacterium]